VPQPVAAPQKQPKAKNAPETLLPQEELEQREMQQLKDMLNGMSGKAKPAPQPAKPVQVAPQPKVQPAPAQPAAEPEKAPAKAAQNAAEELPLVVFASAPADPETLPKKPEKKSIFQMFGTAEDEKPAARKPEKEENALEEIREQASNLDATQMKNEMLFASDHTTGKDAKTMEEDGFSLTDTEIPTVVTETDKMKMRLAKSGEDISYFGDGLSECPD